MKQLAERLVLCGHEVTVATSRLQSRDFTELNGVQIKEFDVSGNLARGMTGEIEAYRHFVSNQPFDVIMIKAAQQWTFDALWPILPQIKARKIFIPCGFSGLYEPLYTEYFQQMPEILRLFDHLIFYATDYRDINFAREYQLQNLSVISNGASEKEFSASPDPLFRKRYGIGNDDFLFLTVGSFTKTKGHFEVVSAFEHLETNRPATLILNGNDPSCPKTTLKSTVKKFIRNSLKEFGIIKNESWVEIARNINNKNNNKKVLITDMHRQELVQAFMAADLFVFASNIEYSPLVLYEAAAAGTAFLTVPVGNAEEIALWTGGGEICPASVDKSGYTRVDPKVLAEHMSKLAQDRNHLYHLGATGKKNWAEKFTWDKIVLEYEKVFKEVIHGNRG
ncbi:MAG: glycosyltransferase family 4 protein [Thermincolia bacterium]